MKTVFLVLTIVLVAFVAINRQRLYLRDPPGAMYRNDVKVEGAHVLINYTNDVLVQIGSGLQVQEYLVQGWSRVPGVPVELKCLEGLLCLAEADHAPIAPISGATRAAMTNREVSFADGAGAAIRITLR